MYERLVCASGSPGDTDWVASHAKDANVRVVEVDVDTKAYDEGHVPGAIAWAWNTQLCDTVIRDILPEDGALKR